MHVFPASDCPYDSVGSLLPRRAGIAAHGDCGYHPRSADLADAALQDATPIAVQHISRPRSGRNHAVEPEFVIVTAALALQVVAWLAFIASLLVLHRPLARGSRYLVLGSLIALSVVLLLAAGFRHSCAISAGLTVALLMLVLIQPPGRDWMVDPYTLLYPQTEETA